MPARRIGLLLAAGRGSRFDPSGAADKLLAPIDGEPAVLRALRTLAAAVDTTIAVVRADARGERIAALLRAAGAEVVPCPDAHAGMGHSLACAAAAAAPRRPDCVVVMLGDMPFVRPETVARVVDAVREPQQAAAPRLRGARGHPVAFGAAWLDRLARLEGDRGAGELLRATPPQPVDVDDEGVLLDIDTPADLDGPPSDGAAFQQDL